MKSTAWTRAADVSRKALTRKRLNRLLSRQFLLTCPHDIQIFNYSKQMHLSNRLGFIAALAANLALGACSSTPVEQAAQASSVGAVTTGAKNATAPDPSVNCAHTETRLFFAKALLNWTCFVRLASALARRCGHQGLLQPFIWSPSGKPKLST